MYSRDNKKMNPEIKALWVEALTSGAYKKGKGKLRQIAKKVFSSKRAYYDSSENRYCCLGVLSDLYAEKTNRGHWERQSDGTYMFLLDGITQNLMPHTTVRDWAKLDYDYIISLDEEDAKKYNKGSRDMYMPNANDQGTTFKTMAKLIDKYL